MSTLARLMSWVEKRSDSLMVVLLILIHTTNHGDRIFMSMAYRRIIPMWFLESRGYSLGTQKKASEHIVLPVHFFGIDDYLMTSFLQMRKEQRR